MVKTRFAPSPTGSLHIGGARTCLFSWLYARSRGGSFVLRIEDTDRTRSKQEYLEEILESLKWLGLDWDEIYYQSRRFKLYQEYANKLVSQGKAYEKEGAIFFKYDFEDIQIDDLIKKKVVFKELPKEEEVIIKSDKSPTYNFSCVIDDALMEITHVIRGDDHMSNTPKQILMYQALGFKVPNFAHVPLIMAEEGGRLSKRFGATSIEEYRKAGFLPQAVVNYLLLLGWSPGSDQEIIEIGQAQKKFDIKDVNKAAASFSLDKFTWLNSHYVKSSLPQELYPDVVAVLEKSGFLICLKGQIFALRMILAMGKRQRLS
jgi:glutamyl/glutaminyl-tRNA synthetase